MRRKSEVESRAQFVNRMIAVVFEDKQVHRRRGGSSRCIYFPASGCSARSWSGGAIRRQIQFQFNLSTSRGVGRGWRDKGVRHRKGARSYTVRGAGNTYEPTDSADMLLGIGCLWWKDVGRPMIGSWERLASVSSTSILYAPRGSEMRLVLYEVDEWSQQ